MRKINKNCLRVINSLAFRAVLFCAVGVSAFAQTTIDIDALAHKQIADRKIPGASVAVIRDGKVLAVKGYGFENLESKIPATENTVYEIASITKQFTAAGILLLVEDGKIKLDEPVGKYLDTLPEAWRGVTVRQLLNQTSGIKNYTTVAAMEQEKDYTAAEMIKFVADAPLEFAPGTNWQYSNTNYFLLGLIIEKISGKSYAEFMRRRIFKPLKMSATQINDHKATIKNRAVGYKRNQGDFKTALRVSPTHPFAAGAIVSTVSDMAKWDAALSGEKLLKRQSLEQMFAPSAKVAADNPAKYGFG